MLSAIVGEETLEHGSKKGVQAYSAKTRRPHVHGKVLNRAETTVGPGRGEIVLGVLEHDRCRHALASVLVLGMDLEAVIQIGRRYRCSSHSSSRGIPRSMMPRESSDLTRQLEMMVSPLSRSKTHWLS